MPSIANANQCMRSEELPAGYPSKHPLFETLWNGRKIAIHCQLVICHMLIHMHCRFVHRFGGAGLLDSVFLTLEKENHFNNLSVTNRECAPVTHLPSTSCTIPFYYWHCQNRFEKPLSSAPLESILQARMAPHTSIISAGWNALAFWRSRSLLCAPSLSRSLSQWHRCCEARCSHPVLRSWRR